MTETKTGTDIIREVLIARNKKLNLARLQQECLITGSQFSDFIAGKTIPSATILCALARWLFPHGHFDPSRNLLVAGDTSKPKPLGTVPQDNTAIIQQYGPQPRAEFKGFRIVRDALATGQPPKLDRPGWAANMIGWMS